MQQRILVIGSSNTDMVVKANKLPAPGETVIGGVFLMNPGGKGANQAVAAARLGADVTFVAKVGNDIFGKQAIQGFRQDKIRTEFVFADPKNPSGVALIGVDERGENSIMVAPGANGHLRPHEVIQALEAVPEARLLLLQLEIPLETVIATIEQGANQGLNIILNPAPAQPLPDEIYAHLFAITPNETETKLLTGMTVEAHDLDSLREAAAWFLAKGLKNVIITLGAKGAFLYNSDGGQLIAAPPVTATDTTAAGDVFNGALVVALSENKSLTEAVTFACKAASISVTRMGAQASVPTRKEVDSLSLMTPITPH
ncbi:ribokinase [Runella slithyformis]|uniref:Ribokinase n=1 Tax=Runella slithyformis (strain ATCC 29530 / DSM 19594 / LMG 11500 / NCIMB 11436 / LSU 4) TaxID=761193 RepID=A0A7U3ZPN4_RUNSL|nr:ribokinase [Runella slithyformis]AEI51072.1 ribokinase [Runella slithyformis DSM 19594]